MTAEPTPVGVRLREYIEFRNSYKATNRWSQARLAQAAGISEKHLSQIITGRAILTPAMAVLLERETDGDLDAIELMHLSVDHAVASLRARP